MTINAASKVERPHPPLARDGMGNLLPIPGGTAAWRICRETAGRPGEIKGPDKQPFRFPLDTTSDELVEMCGLGVYRIYALDELGKQLDHVSTLDLNQGARELRNANAESTSLSALRPIAAISPMSDLRFALEAMTAMMRTNSDALRMVAESHVDLAKTIAAVKGMPRNAAMPIPAPPASESTDDDDDDEEEEERPRHWVELMMPLAEKAAEVVPALVMGKVMQRSANDSSTPREQGDVATDTELASKPNWEFRDLVDLNYAAAKAKAKKTAKQAAEAGATASATPKPSLQSRVMADPKLFGHFVAIKSLLSADEAAQLLELGQRASEQEQEWLLGKIRAATPETAAAVLRGMLADLNQADPSTDPSKGSISFIR
jgi:hypothetical protein